MTEHPPLEISATDLLSLTKGEIEAKIEAWKPQGLGHVYTEQVRDGLRVVWRPLPGQQEPDLGPAARALDEGRDEPDQDVLDALMASAEGVSTALGACLGPFVDKIMDARATAASLEQDLAEARRHLDGVVRVLTAQGTTWSHDAATLADAQAYLEREA